MAAEYHTFTSTRPTEPDPPSLLAACRTFDASIGIQHAAGSGVWQMKKNSPWLPAQIAAAQQQIENAPASSPQLTAQAQIDEMGMYDLAQNLTLLDAINVIRAALQPPLPAITGAQMKQAMRDKAGAL
jgi:hypothetical protein